MITRLPRLVRELLDRLCQLTHPRVLPSLSFRRNLNSPRATESWAGCSRIG